MSDPELQRALAAMGQSGRLGSERPDVEVIQTEWTDFNEWLLQCGGLPRGRAVELYAATSVGKSTFAQWLVGQVQKQTFNLEFGDGTKVKRQGTACWFDAEGTLMKDYASSSGMDLDRTVMPEFSLGSDFRYKLQQAIALDVFDIIVVDSIQAIQPDSLADKAGDRSMNDKLRPAVFWNQTFTEITGGFIVRDASGKLIQSKHPEHVYMDQSDDNEDGDNRRGKREKETTKIHKLENKKCVLIFINHERTKISTGFARGPKSYTPGGSTKDFFFSVRIALKQKAAKTGKTKGNRTLKFKEIEFKIAKNKLGVPLRTAIANLGIDGRLMLNTKDLTEIKTDVEAGAVDEDEEEGNSLGSLKERLRGLKKEDTDDAEDEEGSEDGSGEDEDS